MKGFKEFILRGNLVELAVAFIMALASQPWSPLSSRSSSTSSARRADSPDFSNYTPGGVHVGAFLTAVIAFLILAAVVYFVVVLPYMKAARRGSSRPRRSRRPTEDIILLTEIRDLLRAPLRHDRVVDPPLRSVRCGAGDVAEDLGVAAGRPRASRP